MTRPVEVAYVVLAHRDPDQVARLGEAVRRRDPAAEVVVAYNGELDAAGAAALEAAGVRRVGSGRPAAWGAFDLVERTLEALAAVPAGAWAVLVSGDSHPCPALPAWLAEVARSGADVVVEDAPTAGDPMLEARLALRWRVWARPRGGLALVGFRALNAALGRLGPRPRVRAMSRGIAVGYRRRPVPPVAGRKGSQWFAVGPSARARLLELGRQPEVRDRFVDSLIPDESFVPTLAVEEGWRVLHRPVMCVVWPYEGSPHPRALGPDDLDVVLASGAPFCRKLEGSAGRDLARRLDAASSADA